MFVAIDKATAVRMYDLVAEEWQTHLGELRERAGRLPEPAELADLVRSGKIRLVTYQQLVARTGLAGMHRPSETSTP
jgi:hypothetical protein